jgi:alkylation response protein AidB-like acyl-CoA dehydrogenase
VHFVLSEEQQQIRDAVRSTLAAALPTSRVRQHWAGEETGIGALLADLGVLGLELPEAEGGMGLGPTWWIGVMEEAGYAALPYPLIEQLAALPLLPEVDRVRGRALAGRVAAGEARVAVGLSGGFVHDADRAELILLIEAARVARVHKPSLELQRGVDGARRMFRVEGELEWLNLDGRLLFDRAALAASAEQLGAAKRMLEIAVAYAKARQQFGKPIGAFQAVQHQLVDAALKIAFAAPLVLRAAWSIEHDDPLRSVHVSMARHHAIEAAELAARKALQVHGAIGYTFEYDLHLWMKRAWSLARAWGDTRFHATRVADHLLEDAHG